MTFVGFCGTALILKCILEVIAVTEPSSSQRVSQQVEVKIEQNRFSLYTNLCHINVAPLSVYGHLSDLPSALEGWAALGIRLATIVSKGRHGPYFHYQIREECTLTHTTQLNSFVSTFVGSELKERTLVPKDKLI